MRKVKHFVKVGEVQTVRRETDETLVRKKFREEVSLGLERDRLVSWEE